MKHNLNDKQATGWSKQKHTSSTWHYLLLVRAHVLLQRHNRNTNQSHTYRRRIAGCCPRAREFTTNQGKRNGNAKLIRREREREVFALLFSLGARQRNNGLRVERVTNERSTRGIRILEEQRDYANDFWDLPGQGQRWFWAPNIHLWSSAGEIHHSVTAHTHKARGRTNPQPWSNLINHKVRERNRWNKAAQLRAEVQH